VKEATDTQNAGESVKFVFNTTDTGVFLLKDQAPSEYCTIKQLLAKKKITRLRGSTITKWGKLVPQKWLPKRSPSFFVPSKADETLYDKSMNAMAKSTKINKHSRKQMHVNNLRNHYSARIDDDLASVSL
jgi:hypothetical protein